MNTPLHLSGERRGRPSSTLSTSTVPMVVMVILTAWLGASCLLDLVIMPALYGAGMMDQPSFAMVGDLIFSTFNRVELLAGAIVLTSCLIVHALTTTPNWQCRVSLGLALILMVIPLIYTYDLTPQMSGLGMQLNLFETPEISGVMDQLHLAYWGLEILKLTVGSLLIYLASVALHPKAMGSLTSGPRN